jgi:hypothetical protein
MPPRQPARQQTPRRFARAFALAVAATALLPLAAHAQTDKSTLNALEGYFDFVDVNAGTLMPEQVPAEDYQKLHVVDVRDAAQFSQGHILGAVNIEWRQVFAQRAKLPKDKTLLLLYGGYNEWRARGGLDAHARAGKKG